GMVMTARSGWYFHDRMGLSNEVAGLATEPDGMFVSRQSRQSGRVRFVIGRRNPTIRIEGSPDMALEVVSPSSVVKDIQELPHLYWVAGVSEYWRVDPRGSRVRFQILRHTPKGYVAVRPQSGWLRSEVFDKSFRLTQRTDEDGMTGYNLEVR